VVLQSDARSSIGERSVTVEARAMKAAFTPVNASLTMSLVDPTMHPGFMGKADVMEIVESTRAANDVVAMHEDLFESGWTDGLPVVPPTRARVAEFVKASGLPADHGVC